jgi:lactate dehydrogenase-like 2-hydroxyacid dehydrogenase
MGILVLSIVDLAPAVVARLREQGIDSVLVNEAGGRAAAIAGHPGARAMVTSGSQGFTAAEIGQLPALELVCTVGAGYEGIDLDAIRSRGIALTNSAGTNANAVADHAFALLMALASQIVPYHAIVSRGDWPKLNARNREEGEPDPAGGLPAKRQVAGARLGVLGLGIIGRKIADRGANGFGMEVAYHNRQPRHDAPYRYVESLADLATWADFLVCAAPGGAATRHLVNREVLAALGPSSYVVNIGRGTVIDTDALIDALDRGAIAGAGIDVVAGEPEVPERLRASNRVALTPHFAGRSAESAAASQDLLVANLTAWFAGEPVRNRIA